MLLGNGNPLQYSCLENPMDREAWQATVHGVAKSWTRLSDQTTTTRKTTGAVQSEKDLRKMVKLIFQRTGKLGYIE